MLYITKFHSEPDHVLIDDQFYCETSLRKLLTSSTANKRRWLMRVKASRARKAAMVHQQPLITKFFTNKHTRRSTPRTKEHTRNTKTTTTQQLMTQFYPERDSNRPVDPRNKSTQQLITQFLQERAPNLDDHSTIPSPTPSIREIG